MPLLLGIGSVCITAFLTVQAFLGKGDAKGVKLSVSWIRFFALVGVSLLYALTLGYVGYLLGTFAFLLAVLKISGVTGWVKPLVISLATSAVFYCVFKLALGVMLPGGLLGF